MKTYLRSLALCLGLAATPLFAGTSFDKSVASEATDTAAQSAFPFEFELEYSYIGGSDVARGSRYISGIDENYGSARFIYTPRVKFGILRLGVAYERFGFGMPGNVQLPETLQSLTAVVGLDTQFSDSILVRFEAQPGLYGTDHNFSDGTFIAPFIFGGTYIYNPNLQFVLGVSVNYDRRNSVLPGGGVRWRMTSQLVLNAVLPTPRLELEVNKNLTIFAGANLKGSTFRTDDEFGSRAAGDSRLNRAVLSYTEVRTGVGVDWKLSPDVKLSFEGGYVPWREFDYHRTPVRYHHEEGAPYGSIAFRAAF